MEAGDAATGRVLANLAGRTIASLGGLLTLLSLFSWQVLPALSDERPRRILLLYAYNYTFPSAAIAADSARDRLQQRSPQRIELYVENLDLIRFSEPGQQQLMADFLHDRYAKRQPELVMVVGGEALPFVIRNRDNFAPGVPVVFVGTSRVTLSAMQRPTDVTGHAGDQSVTLANTLTLAERLQPSARRLYIIAGSGPNDRRWQEIVRTTLEIRLRKFETTYLFERTYDELLAEVPSDSIVIMLTVIHDRSGKLLIPRDVMRAVLKVSKAPVYSPHAFIDAPGYVGGFVETDESWGRVGADIALEILAGKPAASIPPRAANGQYQVDYDVLQRFGLSESNLPPEVVVRHKPPSIWDQHRDLVLAALALFLLQSGFVAALLIQRRLRRRAEMLLKASEERMSFTAASVNVGLWQFDRKTGQFWATDPRRELFGLGKDVPLTRDTFLAAVHPGDRATALASLRKIWEAEGSGTHDVRVMLSDGQIRWISVRARANSGDGGNRVSGIFVDVTDQKMAEAEAAQQRQEVTHLMRVSVLGELSGAIAHEINQPLAAVQSNAETGLDLLKDPAPDLAEIRAILEDIAHDNRRAGDVIQRLRNLLMKGERKYEPIDLNELVSSTVNLLNSELIGRRTSLDLNIGNSFPLVPGDPVQLQQVLLNLVMNAMDAMATTPVPQRVVTISAHTIPSGAIELFVKDRGSGLGDGEEGRLFKPFYTTKARGLGLGLSICSTIVEAHGGTLSLTNDQDGGAIARLSLPVQMMLRAAE